MLLIYNFESTKKVTSFIGHKNAFHVRVRQHFDTDVSQRQKSLLGVIQKIRLPSAVTVLARQRYEQSLANFISIGQNLYFNLFAFESRCWCFRHCRLLRELYQAWRAIIDSLRWIKRNIYLH
jgi:hypothetical protein